MSNDPKVAVVILNWNKKDYVVNLLNSLSDIDYDNHDIVVVDNASEDGSQETIKEKFPQATLIENSDNIGGTGGFNTGLAHALEHGGYDYVWLLDNDAEVERGSLRNLISVMRQDDSIGLAGSRIVDPEARNLTVEAGAFVKRDDVDVEPLYRNVRDLNVEQNVVDVDYVAICSALVRIEGLSKVGLMDERFFFFWDDMDWGLQFKKHGFRVVAVLDSVVYHPPFTEKRNPVADYYYSIRNSLLTYSRNFNSKDKFFIFFRHIRYKSIVLILMGLTGRSDIMRLGLYAIWDFVLGNWGGRDFSGFMKSDEPQAQTECEYPRNVKKVFVLNLGNKNEILGALNLTKNLFPDAETSLVIKDDRVDIFRDHVDRMIGIDSQRNTSFFYQVSFFIKLLRMDSDVAVNPGHVSQFSYAFRRVYKYSHSIDALRETGENLMNIWKPITATVLGEILGILIFPIVYMASLTENNSS